MKIRLDEYGKIICAALLYDNCIYMSKKGHYAIFPMEEIGVLRNAIQGFQPLSHAVSVSTSV